MLECNPLGEERKREIKTLKVNDGIMGNKFVFIIYQTTPIQELSPMMDMETIR